MDTETIYASRSLDPPSAPQPLRVAVFGATGLLGRAAVDRLRRDGRHVVALVRTPLEADLPDDVELVAGDITDRAAVARTVARADVAHISVSGGHDVGRIRAVEVDGVRAVAELAAAAGHRRVTMISGIFATDEHAEQHAGEAAKLEAERILLGTVSATVFRPGLFADTLPRFVRGGHGLLLGSQPHPVRPLVADDLMLSVSRSYDMPAAAGMRFDAVGTERMLLGDALRAYLDRVRPSARIRTVPLPVARLLDRVILKGELSRTLSIMSLLQRHGDACDPGAFLDVFGAPATSFASWLADLPSPDKARAAAAR
jgi:NADH dehydrogenase